MSVFVRHMHSASNGRWCCSLARRAAPIAFVAVLAVGVGTSPANSQEPNYPSKIVRWIVAVSAGSPVDVMVRKYAEAVQPRLGATIIVDNRPGATGTIGANAVAKAAPDGYTLLVGLLDPLISGIALMKEPSFDSTKDFRFVSKLLTGNAVLLANKEFKPNTLQEFVATAKVANDPINYGTGGPGTFTHYMMESLAKQSGAKLKAVHYRSAPQATQGMLGNEVSLGTGAPVLAAPMVAEGKLKALAVMGNKRAALLPDVPTFAEAGIDGFVYQAGVGIGMFAPAKTPDAIVDKLAAVVRVSSADPELRRFATAAGLDLIASSPAEFEKSFLAEHAAITKLIRELGITAE